MHTPILFEDLLIILLVSVPVAFACLRLKLPLLVGLMLTGIVIGPYGLGLIKELEAIEVLAEIGVMLLLFTIGLEFSLTRLREMRRLVLVGGGMQVLLTVAITTGIAFGLGRELGQSVFFGFLVALSSTAIVLKSYIERREVDSPHGRAGVGILLFQDISVVLMMLFLPILGGKEALTVGALARSLGGSLLALVVIVGLSALLIPKILRQVGKLRSPEVFLLTVVLLFLAISFATSQFGLSLALGAFIAGMVLSESDYSHQVTADILPFRDVFNSIFFVSIGLLLSVGALWANLWNVLGLVVFLFALKFLIIWAVVWFMRLPQRVAVMTALGLAQIGEFSFILAKAGKPFSLLSESDYQSFLAASIISMLATPFLIAVAPRLGYFVQSFIADKPDKDLIGHDDEEIHLTSSGGLKNHVVIVGYGLNGRNLARVLRSVGISYAVLDLNAETVSRAKAKGEKINFGDATRREVLHHAHIDEAHALVIAISDPDAARRTVKQAREMNQGIYILVRTRYTSEIGELMKLGANEVIPEEFETSIEIFSRVLQCYRIDRLTIESQIGRIRRQGYEMLRSPSLPQIAVADLDSVLESATTESIKLRPGSPVIGKRLSVVKLREKTDVTLMAAIRDGETMIGPGRDFAFAAGDILVLFGKNEKIEAAVTLLQGEENENGFNP
ncbi:MAG: cation:proton antiporter [Acidobacteria bacterium]|nr:cation:proton antiporter [Acidobacteriota bacterium]MBK8810331.1 cation:proton antiporter [Acidobacteriota bacterium]